MVDRFPFLLKGDVWKPDVRLSEVAREPLYSLSTEPEMWTQNRCPLVEDSKSSSGSRLRSWTACGGLSPSGLGVQQFAPVCLQLHVWFLKTCVYVKLLQSCLTLRPRGL